MSALSEEITELVNSLEAYGEAVNGNITETESNVSALGNEITTLSNTVSNIALVRGLFNALQLNANGTSNTVNILATEMTLKDGAGHVVVISNVNAPITTAAVGTAGVGAGGLDTGNWAANTWYSAWVIYNETTGTTKGIASLSATLPTLPSGYTFYVRVGWFKTDTTVTGRPLAFTQKGAQVTYKVGAGTNVTQLPQIASGQEGDTTIPTWVALPWAAFAPSTAIELGVLVSSTGGSCTTMAAPNNSYGAWNSTTNPPPIMWSNEGTFTFAVQEILLESADIFWASNPGAQPPVPGSSGNTGILSIAGWTDNI